MVKEKFEKVEEVVKKEEEEDVEEKGCRRWRRNLFMQALKIQKHLVISTKNLGRVFYFFMLFNDHVNFIWK